jgi:fumarylacetoacetate (FAA) hydrolase
MKLATLRDRTRDGMLVVVSRDLTRCISARPIAATLQAALDDWDHAGARLADLAHDLELGSVPWQRFHEHDALAPLPRAYQWLAGGETGRGLEPSDGFVPPRAALRLTDATPGVDLAIGLAAVLDDVPAAPEGFEVADAILLVLLASHATAGGEAIATTFAPVAVTPDELGLDPGDLTGLVDINGKPSGRIGLGAPASDWLAGRVAAAARLRPLAAGTIIGDRAEGAANLAVGDSVHIRVKSAAGHSIFGAIDQPVERISADAVEPAGDLVDA